MKFLRYQLNKDREPERSGAGNAGEDTRMERCARPLTSVTVWGSCGFIAMALSAVAAVAASIVGMAASHGGVRSRHPQPHLASGRRRL